MTGIGKAKSDAAAGPPPARRPPGGWRKALLGLSILLMAGGLALQGWAYIRRPAGQAGATGPRRALPVKGFLPDSAPPSPPPDAASDAAGADGGVKDWYPAPFRLGFGFFVGFCIAYALRTFLRVSLAAIGVVLLVLLGLRYAGVITIDWARMETHYDTLSRWLGQQTANLRALITGYLPSSASGVAGLIVGFRKG